MSPARVPPWRGEMSLVRLEPIDQMFAKLEALLRETVVHIVDKRWDVIGGSPAICGRW